MKAELIDRQRAIDVLDTGLWGVKWDKALATAMLKDLPSAEPKWIPCSERLPEDDELMLVNYIDERPDAMDIWIGWHEMENVWYIDGKAHSSEFGNEVVAWMPLPQPYTERREEHD